jgi:hypothetical protein
MIYVFLVVIRNRTQGKQKHGDENFFLCNDSYAWLLVRGTNDFFAYPNFAL